MVYPMVGESTMKRFYPSKSYYSYKTKPKKNFLNRLREYLIQHYYSPTVLSSIFSVFVKNVPAIPTYAPKGKILDVGCGSGGTLQMLSELGWITYGLEIDKLAVHMAHRIGQKRVYIGGYRKMNDFPPESFDAIRLYHVIEHLDDPVRCLRLIRRGLKANGEVILGIPNAGGLLARIFGKYWYGLDCPRHRFAFTQANLKSLLEQNGFTPTQTGYFSAGGLLGSVQYYLYERFGIRRDLVNTLFLVFLTYPFEWLADFFRMGDVCVIRARKAV